MSDLLIYFKDQQQHMVDLLTKLVNYETPSHDKTLVDKLGVFIEQHCQTLGASSVMRYPQNDVGDHLLAKWNEEKPGNPITFIGHMDTVWPSNTLAERPVRIDDEGRLFGPGAVDMKGGLVTALTAIRGLRERGEMPDRPIWFLFNSDEEIGSKSSTPIIEAIASQSDLILVMEPGTKEGAIKIQRKGIATYQIHVEGRASHAGNTPEEGINAIIELAQQALRLHSMNDLKNGTSVSVTKIEGGTAGNVIPAKASAFVDTRMLTHQAMDQTRAAILGLEPFVPGAKVRVEPIHARSPLEFNDLMKATFARCQEIGKKHGITVRGDSAGGGSDGNTTASMGIPTLDGLGAYGDGLHAVHEHVLISSLPQRAALVAAILKDWSTR